MAAQPGQGEWIRKGVHVSYGEGSGELSASQVLVELGAGKAKFGTMAPPYCVRSGSVPVTKNGNADYRHDGGAGVEDQACPRRCRDTSAPQLDGLTAVEDGVGEAGPQRQEQWPGTVWTVDRQT